jgi:hypothetical protein
MRRKFYEGYRQGLWTIVKLEHKNKKALLRCDCGYEGWKFLSNLSSHNSQGCRNCMLQSPEHKTYLMVLRTASRRSIKWNISENDWIKLATQNCYYCESKPKNIIKEYGFFYNGLDRIDPSIGYDLTNVVTCCKICNRAKSDLSQEEFYEWIKEAYETIISK